MKASTATGILIAAVLVGCGSSGGGEDGFGPATDVVGNLSPSFTATYDATTDTLTLDDGTTTTVLARQMIYDGAEFKGYYLAGSPSSFAIYAETPTGDGYALTAVWPAAVNSGSEFARVSETLVPDGGTATYTGEYGAFLVYDTTGVAYRLLFGDAELMADFAADTISGVISNRVDFDNAAVTFDDVTLEAGSISGGGFSGEATGGAGNGSIVTTVDPGAYSGLFTGPDGEQVVGGVVLGHTYLGDPVTEYGAFVAD